MMENKYTKDGALILEPGILIPKRRTRVVLFTSYTDLLARKEKKTRDDLLKELKERFKKHGFGF